MTELRQESGTVLLDAFMSLLLGSIILTAAFSSFSSVWSRSVELRIKTQLLSEARLILDMVAFDLRMSGSGMPLGQAHFTSENPEIGELALPLSIVSNGSQVKIRLNEFGTSTITSAPFSSDTGTRVVSVASTSGFKVGDIIYISNMPTGGNDGLQGTIERISGLNMYLSHNVAASPSATFPAGSVVEPAKEITYSTSESGITRDDGSGAIVVAPASSLSISYLDSHGAALPLPLSREIVTNDLSAVYIQVNMRSVSAPADSTAPYSTTTAQTVALRNINLNR